MGRRLGQSHPGSIADRAVDWLSMDGGWWTVDGLALVVRADPKSVYQSLRRMRRTGVVRSRFADHCLEWRAA